MGGGRGEVSVSLREKYSGIIPGYHMNKTHWNTVECNGSVPDDLILKLTDHSYQLIFNSLPAKVRGNKKIESVAW